MPKDDLVPVSIEIQAATKESLQKIADDNYRSLTGQIRMVLESYLDGELVPKQRKSDK